MSNKSGKTYKVFIRIRTDRIGWLKFIIEAYDGLGLVTTLSVPDGLVQLWVTEGKIRQLFELLDDLAPKLNRKISVQA